MQQRRKWPRRWFVVYRVLAENIGATATRPFRRGLFALWLAVVCIALAQLVLPAPVAGEGLESRVLRLASGEWPPYTGRHLPAYGCDSQVVSEAFALVGIRVEYVFFPWARGMLLSRNGIVDGAVEWEDTSAHRTDHFVSREPLSMQEWAFFHRKSTSVVWQDLEDLHQQRIGLTIGYAYSEVFKAMQGKYPRTFNEAASDVLNFKKLINNHIDLFPMERAVGQYLLQSTFTTEEQNALAIHPQSIKEFAPHLLLSRRIDGNQQRMQLFNQGLQQLQARGRYRQIMATCSHSSP